MYSKIAFLCCLLALAHAVPKRIPRVAHGNGAQPGEHPHFVSLYHKYTLDTPYPISFCGGAILNEEWILTAAYCVLSVRNVDEVTVKAGNIYYSKESDTEQSFDVAASFVHPKYDDPIGGYDLGLLKLAKPIKFNKFVSPIDLPENDSIPSGKGVIAGLGSVTHMMNALFPESLQAAELPIISNEECNKRIHDTIGNDADELNLLDEYRFCTGSTKTNQGYCLHDTGSPLVAVENGKNVLVGVATFGFAADCETPGLPSIYSRVSAFEDWIHDIIKAN